VVFEGRIGVGGTFWVVLVDLEGRSSNGGVETRLSGEILDISLVRYVSINLQDSRI
jgi:hypothetical protein